MTRNAALPPAGNEGRASGSIPGNASRGTAAPTKNGGTRGFRRPTRTAPRSRGTIRSA